MNTPATTAPAVFQFTPSFQLRVIDIHGQPWFVAADVAEALEYRNAPDMVRMLDDDEVGTTQIVRSTSGGNPNLTIINESGLYSAILRSRKPEAKRFKKWVTSEVLPAIRRTGQYTAPVPAAAPCRDYLTGQDMANLKHMISLISSHFGHSHAAVSASWSALRRVTRTPSPQPFKKSQLSDIAFELERQFSVVEVYIRKRREVEAELLKRMIRGGEDAHPLLRLLMTELDDAVTEQSGKIDQVWHAMFTRARRNLMDGTMLGIGVD